MSSSDAGSAARQTILLADDEAHLRTLVRTTLEDPGYRIVEAATGTAALDLIRSERPDLVVLDLMMPGLSGLEVLGRLRGEPETARIPVVMLTATGQDKDRRRALKLGADAYLVKPFSPLELLQTVEALRRRTRELREQAEQPTAGATPSTDTPATPHGSVAEGNGRGSPEATEPRAAEPLEVAESQLALYARDLKQAMEAERAKAEQLAAANARLLLLDRLKSDFLSFISHELRTPLNALSAVGLFDPEADPADQREIVELMRGGYERLESFVRLGLEYFDRLASGSRETDARVELGPLVDELARRARERGIALDLAVERCSVCAPAADVEQVLEILLANTVKFSPGGARVRLEVRRAGATAVIRVADRGVGFPPELAEEIFRPFTITDPLHHSRGTGIHLALARAIVESVGGRIRARSSGPGAGAVFEIELPL